MAYSVTIAGVTKTIQVGWSISASLNSADTFQFAIRSYTGSYRPALDDEVIFLDGATKRFGGHIIDLDEHGIINALGKPMIETSVTAANYNHLPSRVTTGTLTVPIGTVKSFLQVLVTFLTPFGVSLDGAQATGIAIPQTIYDYQWLDQALNDLSTLCGWPWKISYDKVLGLYAPGGVSAPFNIVTGDRHTIGDIKVTKTRSGGSAASSSGYANRVYVKFNNIATGAFACLVATSNYANGETVTIGGKVYTFQNALTDTDGNVLIGGDADASSTNLTSAIVLGGGAGSLYAASTTKHTSVVAWRNSFGKMNVRAMTPGAAGNSIAVSTTAVNAVWHGMGSNVVTALEGGSDQALTNMAMAESAGEQAAHGLWEAVISSETTDTAVASALAAAYLLQCITGSRTVVYDTPLAGLEPGQTQTINRTNRGINGSYLITQVETRNRSRQRLRTTVTAIEGSIYQGSWRDAYSIGGGSGAPAVTGGSGGGGGGGGGSDRYDFGGSQIEWLQSTGSWVIAGSKEAWIDTSARGTVNATCYVRLRAASGTVTAQLVNITDNVAVGTSPVVASSTFQSVSFSVSLTPGRRLYRIQLLPSVPNVDVQMGSGYVE